VAAFAPSCPSFIYVNGQPRARPAQVLWVSVAFAAVSCGGSSRAPASPTATTTAQTAQFTGRVGPGLCEQAIAGITPTTCIASHDLGISRDGTMTATLTWNGSANMGLVVTQTSCSTYDFYGCGVAASSQTKGSTQQRVNVAVANGQAVRFWAQNEDATAAADYTIAIDIR
jgi:hypothetical protein